MTKKKKTLILSYVIHAYIEALGLRLKSQAQYMVRKFYYIYIQTYNV